MLYKKITSDLNEKIRELSTYLLIYFIIAKKLSLKKYVFCEINRLLKLLEFQRKDKHNN